VQVPEQTVLVARAVFPQGSVAMCARDELAEAFADEQFAAGFGVRGAPAESPGALALVTALQFVENLTDRQAAQMVARAIDWKYALGLELTHPGFDASVLSKFRTRLVAHGLEEQVFATMLGVLASAPTTTSYAPAGSGTTLRYARSATDSSASSTAA